MPQGTTSILVTVNWTYGAGSTTDGYLDDLSLTLDTAVTRAEPGRQPERRRAELEGLRPGHERQSDLTSHGYYYNDDDAFLDYADNITPASYCAAHNQPLTQLSTDLASTSTTPAFSWVVADDYSDMDAGGVAPGDSWLSSTLPQIFKSPAWTTQRSLLIVSWDEGYTKSYGPSYPNQVATYMVASQGLVKAGYTSTTYYDQYSLLATIERALGLAPLTSNDEYAQSVSDIWKG